MSAALEVRGIPTTGRLTAAVEGDIADVDDVLKISAIRLRYRLVAALEGPERIDTAKLQRALETYAEKCPAYQSVKGCIDCRWDLDTVGE